MKLFKLLFLLLPVMIFVSCDKEEEPECIQADWIGTYVGTQSGECFGTGATTVTITASGDEAIVIFYEDGDGSSSEYDPITFNECNISDSQSDASGLSLDIEVLLEGNEITITETLSFEGEASTCTVTATKQ